MRDASNAPATDLDNKKGIKRSLAERMGLKGKTTVITGGARGIGLAIAEAAAELGSNIAVLDILEEPAKDISKFGAKAKYYRQVSRQHFYFKLSDP